MVISERDGEPGARAVIAVLHPREGELPVDDAFLYAAHHLGLEVNLQYVYVTEVWEQHALLGCVL